MASANGSSKATTAGTPIKDQPGNGHPVGPFHPAWLAFVRYCQELHHGEIDCLKIQDGLPVLAEVTTKKVRFEL